MYQDFQVLVELFQVFLGTVAIAGSVGQAVIVGFAGYPATADIAAFRDTAGFVECLDIQGTAEADCLDTLVFAALEPVGTRGLVDSMDQRHPADSQAFQVTQGNLDILVIAVTRDHRDTRDSAVNLDIADSSDLLEPVVSRDTRVARDSRVDQGFRASVVTRDYRDIAGFVDVLVIAGFVVHWEPVVFLGTQVSQGFPVDLGFLPIVGILGSHPDQDSRDSLAAVSPDTRGSAEREQVDSRGLAAHLDILASVGHLAFLGSLPEAGSLGTQGSVEALDILGFLRHHPEHPDTAVSRVQDFPAIPATAVLAGIQAFRRQVQGLLDTVVFRATVDTQGSPDDPGTAVTAVRMAQLDQEETADIPDSPEQIREHQAIAGTQDFVGFLDILDFAGQEPLVSPDIRVRLAIPATADFRDTPVIQVQHRPRSIIRMERTPPFLGMPEKLWFTPREVLTPTR